MKGLSKKTFLINLIGVMMSRGVFMTMSPIGIGFFAAAYLEKSTRLLLVLGTIAGTATVMPIIETVKYGIIVLAIVIVTGIVENHKTNKISPPVMGIIAGVVTCAVSVSKGMAYAGYEYYLLMAVMEGIIVFAAVGIFHKGITYILYSKKGELINNEQLISLSVMAGVFVYSVPSVENIEFSFVEMAVFFLILYMGYRYGSGAGAIAGASCGLVVGIQNQMNSGGAGLNEVTPFQIIGIYCILGVFAGIFREVGRLGTTIGFFAATLIVGSVFENYIIEIGQVRALASGAVIFLLFPTRLIEKAELIKSEENEYEFVKQNIQSMAKKKLKEFSESFLKLSNTFRSIADTKISLTRNDINGIFDDLSDKLCKDCINCDSCWKNSFYDTYKAAFAMLSSAEKNGYVLEGDIPMEFTNKCIHINEFLNETNKSLELAKLNLNWHNRMAESREAIAGQLGEVASIIADFSQDLYDTMEVDDSYEAGIVKELQENQIEIRQISILEKRNKRQEVYITARMKKGRCITTKEAAAIISKSFGRRMRPHEGSKNIISKEYENFVFVEDTNFKILTGMSRATKQNEKISGDNYSFIRLGNGEMIMTLSDGMGTGVQACEESESVIELLEQFMEAGFREESAIKLINSVLLLKSEKQSFSTIDMSIINQFTGICDFVKIGASTTFIKRDNWVETISSTTLPAGVLNKVDFDGITKKLYDGNFVIMVTDGVLDCISDYDKEKILEEIIMEIKSNNPQEIANYILEKAMEYNNYTPIDDMTVIVAGIWEK